LQSVSEVQEDLAVRVENLSVRYRTSIERKQTLRSFLARGGRNRRTTRMFEALHDVSFEVGTGNLLGIIGPNGAGKSTLLRTLAGILPPSEGRITVWGSVTTLLALGVGFNAELSGRENIRLGCLASGIAPEHIGELTGPIIEFADLGEFIEYPVKTYSSGMYGRLAFSIAVQLKPDILLIDEALSTGDAAFRAKSQDKMRELMTQARAIVLVSHGLGLIREMATEVLWLNKGQVMGYGDPIEMIDAYTESVQVSTKAATDDDA
jgi:teichoic acid transport system ATP-binding protein